MFLDSVSHPAIVSTRLVFCQPFLSSSEQREDILGEIVTQWLGVYSLYTAVAVASILNTVLHGIHTY